MRIDIALVPGTGPDGVITAEDVQKFADAKAGAGAVAAQATASGVEPPSPVARLMAERTTQSWTNVPHFFLVREADAGELIAAQRRLCEEAKKSQKSAPTITDLLIALLARALARFPGCRPVRIGSDQRLRTT